MSLYLGSHYFTPGTYISVQEMCQSATKLMLKEEKQDKSILFNKHKEKEKEKLT